MGLTHSNADILVSSDNTPECVFSCYEKCDLFCNKYMCCFSNKTLISNDFYYDNAYGHYDYAESPKTMEYESKDYYYKRCN